MSLDAISYIRVSTKEQGRSGLGLDAQGHAIQDFADREGFNLIQEFEEIETGKGADALSRRPILKEALEYAEKKKKQIDLFLNQNFSQNPDDLMIKFIPLLKNGVITQEEVLKIKENIVKKTSKEKVKNN